jgi:DNA-binding response OmpR family regulator
MSGPIVLLAFGDDDCRTIYTLYLEHAGFRVLAAADGEQALALARAYPPDLVVAEIPLPGVDGCELAGRLRTHEPTRSTPVVLVDAWDSLADRLRAERSGANRVRSLPLHPSALLDEVRRFTSPAEAPPA